MTFTTGLPAPTARPHSKLSYRTPIDHFGSSAQMELTWTGGDLDDELVQQVSVPKNEDAHIQPLGGAHLIRRAYPSVFDADSPSAPALLILSSAVQETVKAIDCYSDSDLEGVGTRLDIIAALMSQAHSDAGFNPALGAMVSFIRRAALFASPTEVNLPQLMSLAKVIRRMHEDPLISLDSATDFIDELKTQNWVGANPAIAALVSALFQEAPDAASDTVNEIVLAKVVE